MRKSTRLFVDCWYDVMSVKWLPSRLTSKLERGSEEKRVQLPLELNNKKKSQFNKFWLADSIENESEIERKNLIIISIGNRSVDVRVNKDKMNKTKQKLPIAVVAVVVIAKWLTNKCVNFDRVFFLLWLMVFRRQRG